MNRMRLTAAQATVRYLASQLVSDARQTLPYFAGVWAIFGHGNVAGLGEALHGVRDVLPTLRAHNEQGMAHAAIAFAKQMRRRRAMVCTTSIGPGATNLVTAAALAHVNRLPVLLLPGDVYASRRPNPVLQQVEDFADGTVSANDCLKPVSRYFDRISRPEQLLDALPRALAILLDPASCGPVTLAFCQDVQAEAFDFPASFFAPRLWSIRAPHADPGELERLANLLRTAKAPLIIAGGGVPYARAGTEAALAEFALRTGVPVAETQAGKGSLAWDHPLNLGAIGVTGSSAANAAAAKADLVVGLGTRLQDFTTGSRGLFGGPECRLVQVNISPYDAHKHAATSVVGDVGATIADLAALLADWRAPPSWTEAATARIAQWNEAWEEATAPVRSASATQFPTDAQVLGAVWRKAADDAVVVCAAGGLPGELHKLWRTRRPGGYHVEYGYSCMGYEIAGAVGVKMAEPAREVHVLVGDGSYLMMNSELATAVMLGLKLIVTVLDNRGFGCINRLQKSTGAEPFNNLLADSPRLDFAAHAASLGARSQKVADLSQLEAALEQARAADRTCVIVIETDPDSATGAGGAWWDVAVPEVSDSKSVMEARAAYEDRIAKLRRGN
ncbi:MAG: 3D-(3,5/4)-trihydroxycyclohexane-1,2-dione acylhydrolase (decyclizing) [Steroidobacteraceae bacterium]